MPEGSEVREADPLGIVVEGGGCRAIYAAGVLDVFDAAEAFGSTSASRRTSASGASAGGFAPDA